MIEIIVFIVGLLLGFHFGIVLGCLTVFFILEVYYD